MRVITVKRVREFQAARRDAAGWLDVWLVTAGTRDWQSLADVRRDYPRADGVQVGSGRIVTVFDVCGNKYRLITAIHHKPGPGGRVYVLMLMTHAEYSKDLWKDQL